MGHFRKSTLAIRVLLFAAMASATPAAAASFDGEWSVQIASSSTACTNGAAVSLGISNGQIASNSAAVWMTPKKLSRSVLRNIEQSRYRLSITLGKRVFRCATLMLRKSLVLFMTRSSSASTTK